MKKIVIIIILLLMVCGCAKNKPNENQTTTTNNTEVVEIEEYVDNNPVVVSIYKENETGALDKIIDKYETTWEKKKDIVVVATLPTDIEHPEYDYMPNLWPKYSAMYGDISYKIGWNVSFELINGEKINSTITMPSDTADYYDYLEVYLYDDVNVPIGQWHSHLLDEQVTDETIMDAIKLTAGENYEQIKGPITLTVFSYDDENDFDESNNYRGKSLYQVTIYDN